MLTANCFFPKKPALTSSQLQVTVDTRLKIASCLSWHTIQTIHKVIFRSVMWLRLNVWRHQIGHRRVSKWKSLSSWTVYKVAPDQILFENLITTPFATIFPLFSQTPDWVLVKLYLHFSNVFPRSTHWVCISVDTDECTASVYNQLQDRELWSRVWNLWVCSSLLCS